MPLRNNLEKSLRQIRNKKGFYQAFLKTSTYCFEKAIKARNYFYDRGFKKGKKAPLPVVSIGNVLVGGTGKTPFTILLAKTLRHYFKVAIVSRGYRSLAEKQVKPVIVSDGQGGPPLFSADIAGDEAYLMAKNVPEAIVISGKNRFLASLEAKRFGADLVLLDDGMQHRNLLRDIDIALVNGNEYQDKFLPSGFLRDDPKRLQQVDFLVSRGKEFTDAITVKDRVLGLMDREGKIRESLSGTPVFVFCGIAKPDSFVRTVQECGAYVVDFLALADHEKLNETQLVANIEKARTKGARLVLTTEKDFIKYETVSLPLPMLWVKREMYVCANSHKWESLIQRIRGLVV